MAKEKEKKDWSYLNGKYPLTEDAFKPNLIKNGFICIQWYPVCQVFYGIINNNKDRQVVWAASDMIRFLQKYSPGFTTTKKEAV
jgi:hypothetical protein